MSYFLKESLHLADRAESEGYRLVKNLSCICTSGLIDCSLANAAATLKSLYALITMLYIQYVETNHHISDRLHLLGWWIPS
jgi:hypothetical protein